MIEPAAIAAAIATYCRAETTGDKDAFMALFADTVLHEDPVGLAIRHDRAGLEELWGMAQGANVELWLEQDIIVCGNEAMAIMRCRTGPADAPRIRHDCRSLRLRRGRQDRQCSRFLQLQLTRLGR
jgi:SnoaL-like domain